MSAQSPWTLTPADASVSRHPHSEAAASIVVCAYTEDRWVTLRLAVSGVRAQLADGDELIVIVDHNESLLSRCREEFSDCSVISNHHNRGLSGARNTAIEKARGSIVVFIDDDAVPLDGWLNALRTPFHDGRVHGVGGLTTPRWLGGRPKWFPQEFLWVVGCSHRGLPSDPNPVRNLSGANMSFRRSLFSDLGGFAETLGRVGDRPLGCEETEFSIRLTQANPDAILLYDPSAEVEHYLSPRRSTFRYFARRCWAEGLSKAEVSRRVGLASALSAERVYASTVLTTGVWHGVRECVAGDPWGAARAAVIMAGLVITSLGYCVGSLHSSADSGETR